MNTNRDTENTQPDALVRVPPDLHREAKASAALDGISLRELISRLLTEYLRTNRAA